MQKEWKETERKRERTVLTIPKRRTQKKAKRERERERETHFLVCLERIIDTRKRRLEKTTKQTETER